MNKKEAWQVLAGFSPDYFNNFDYSLLEIPYADLMRDGLKGEDKQQYLTPTGHLWFELIGFFGRVGELIRAMRTIADHNNWGFARPHFNHILSKLPAPAMAYINKQYIFN